MKGNDAIELALHWHNYRAKTATVSAKTRERSHTLKLLLEKKSALVTHLAGPQDKLRRLKTSLIKTSKRPLKIFRTSRAYSLSNLPRFHAAPNRKSTHILGFLVPAKRNKRARSSYSF